MPRPLRKRELYDDDIQALLRTNNAILLDANIPEDDRKELTEHLTAVVMKLRVLSDSRRSGVRDRVMQEAKEGRGPERAGSGTNE